MTRIAKLLVYACALQAMSVYWGAHIRIGVLPGGNEREPDA
jgi:hypothetical protein